MAGARYASCLGLFRLVATDGKDGGKPALANAISIVAHLVVPDELRDCRVGSALHVTDLASRHPFGADKDSSVIMEKQHGYSSDMDDGPCAVPFTDEPADVPELTAFPRWFCA